MPRRKLVVVSKFITAIIAALLTWAVTTAVNLTVGSLRLLSIGVPNELGNWEVQRTILVNLMMFVLWSVLGVGIGVLIPNKIGATATASLLYIFGDQLFIAILTLVHQVAVKNDAIFTLAVLYPAVAAEAASTPDGYVLPDGQVVHWWTGCIMMLLWGAVLAAAGTSVLRRRDIS